MHPGRGGHPKIASLLAEPVAALVRDLVRTARNLGIAPTVFAGVRLREQTYVYEDAENPDRPTRVIESPAYVTEDHALLMGLDLYEQSLCSCGCGFPREVAWHSEMDGWFDTFKVKCHAGTAMRGEPVIFTHLVNTYPVDEKGPLPPFVLGLTTASS